MVSDAGATAGYRRREFLPSLKLLCIIFSCLSLLMQSFLFVVISLFCTFDSAFWVRERMRLPTCRLLSYFLLIDPVSKSTKEEALESNYSSSPKSEIYLTINLGSIGSRNISGFPEETSHRSSITTLSPPPRSFMPTPQGIITNHSYLLALEAVISWRSWLSRWMIPVKIKSMAAANDVDLKTAVIYFYGLGPLFGPKCVSSRPIKKLGPSSSKCDKGRWFLLTRFPIYKSWLYMLEVSGSMSIFASAQQPYNLHPFITCLLPGDGLTPVLAILQCIIVSHPPFRFSYRIRLPLLQSIVASLLCRYEFGEENYWTDLYMVNGFYNPNICPVTIPSPRTKIVECFLGLLIVRALINPWLQMSRLGTSSLRERHLQCLFSLREEPFPRYTPGKLKCVYVELFSWLGVSLHEETNESAMAFYGGKTPSSTVVTISSLGSLCGFAGKIASTHLDISPSSQSIDQYLSVLCFFVFKLYFQNVGGRKMPSDCIVAE